MGGDATVASTAGAGSTFTVTLDLAIPEESTIHHAPSPDATGAQVAGACWRSTTIR